MALMRSYLVTKYNINGQFDIVPPNARDFQVMQVLIDLVLCTLHKTINPRDIPEHVQNSCTEAMAWLKDARDGVIIVGLPGQLPSDNNTIYDRSFIDSQVKLYQSHIKTYPHLITVSFMSSQTIKEFRKAEREKYKTVAAYDNAADRSKSSPIQYILEQQKLRTRQDLLRLRIAIDTAENINHITVNN